MTLGLVGLYPGAEWLVRGASRMAAALRIEADIVVGNLVGSNLFNLLGALGLSALLRPVAVDPTLLRFDIVALLVSSAAMALVLRTGNRVSRMEGAVLLLAYGGFVAALFRRYWLATSKAA